MPTNGPPEPEPSGRARLGRQVKKHPFIALGVAIVASFAIGWVFGSKITCGPECNADADMIGAVGTWAGGVGTALALLFTAKQVIASQRQAEKADKLRMHRTLTKAREVECVVPAQKITDAEDKGVVFALSIRNSSDSPITDIRGWSEPGGEEIFHTHQINGRDTEGNPTYWKTPINITDFPAETTPNMVNWLGAQEEEHKKLESVTREDPWIPEELWRLEKLIGGLKKELAEDLKEQILVEFVLEGDKFYWHKGNITPARGSTT